jgi:CBS-domain-containing membrane protein
LLAQAPPVTIGVADPVDHVWDLMAEQRMWLLPVLDGRRLVGIIHYAAAAAANPFRCFAASDRTSTGS